VENLPPQAVIQRLAWSGIYLKEGWIAFQGQTLESAAAEFNMHNSRQLIIGDAATGQLRIGGKFRVTDVDAFLAALAMTHGVRAVHGPAQGNQPETIVLVGGHASGSAYPEGPSSRDR
jgi:transmembrane sensor